MTRRTRWLIFLAIGGPLLLLAAAALAAWALLPTREELARETEARVREALGVEVRIGALDWRLWPRPTVLLTDVSTVQARPLTARHVEATLYWRDLLSRRLALERVTVEGAVVPQLSLHALGAAAQERTAAAVSAPSVAASTPTGPDAQTASGWQLAPVPLAHVSFSDLTWISRRGIPVTYEGEVDFDAGWRPRRAVVARPEVQPRAELTLTRQGDADRWQVRTAIGGGRLDGEVRLATTPRGTLRLTGELTPKDIEVAATVATFNRRPVLSGRGTGRTVLDAEGENIAALARSLHTRTQFRLAPATVQRFDLHKAIRTLGRDHAGQTPLESLTGEMDTQNTGQGTIWSYTGLKATSGALTASGQVAIFSRRIEAQGAVDLVDGLVGAPIKVSGTLDKPQVSVPGSAVAGAVLGTAILPGIGTAIGARLGALFSGDAPAAAASAAASAPRQKPPPRAAPPAP